MYLRRSEGGSKEAALVVLPAAVAQPLWWVPRGAVRGAHSSMRRLRRAARRASPIDLILQLQASRERGRSLEAFLSLRDAARRLPARFRMASGAVGDAPASIPKARVMSDVKAAAFGALPDE